MKTHICKLSFDKKKMIFVCECGKKLNPDEIGFVYNILLELADGRESEISKAFNKLVDMVKELRGVGNLINDLNKIKRGIK